MSNKLGYHEMLSYGHKPTDDDYHEAKASLQQAFDEADAYDEAERDRQVEQSEPRCVYFARIFLAISSVLKRGMRNVFVSLLYHQSALSPTPLMAGTTAMCMKSSRAQVYTSKKPRATQTITPRPVTLKVRLIYPFTNYPC